MKKGLHTYRKDNLFHLTAGETFFQNWFRAIDKTIVTKLLMNAFIYKSIKPRDIFLKKNKV